MESKRKLNSLSGMAIKSAFEINQIKQQLWDKKRKIWCEVQVKTIESNKSKLKHSQKKEILEQINSNKSRENYSQKEEILE